MIPNEKGSTRQAAGSLSSASIVAGTSDANFGAASRRAGVPRIPDPSESPGPVGLSNS